MRDDLFRSGALALSFTLAVCSFSACGGDGSSSAGSCAPACSPGYECVSGQCVSVCNPPCAADEHCDASTRTCEPGGGDSDTDTDTDSDVDTDTDTDTDTDSDRVCAGLPDWDPVDAGREDTMFGLVNALRASGTCHGAAFPEAGALAMNHAIRCGSRKLAKHIGETCDAGACEWSHCSGDAGVGFCQRFQQFGYSNHDGWAGNYMGSDDPQDSLDAWTDSDDGPDADSLPDGCEVVMNAAFTDFGTGSWDGYFWAVGYATPGDRECSDLGETAGDGRDSNCDGADDT